MASVIRGSDNFDSGSVGSTTYDDVGTYVMAYEDVGNFTENTTISGGSLTPMGFIGNGYGSLNSDAYQAPAVTRGGSALSGTWRRMCRSNSVASWWHGGLYVRIS